MGISDISHKLIEKGHKATIFCTYNINSQQMLGMMLPLFHKAPLEVLTCKDQDELESTKTIFKEILNS